jgi:type IV fimbrial biogenesis protein FimT
MKTINFQGVTLVEIMVGLGIVAILLALALPNYRSFVLNNRRASQANEFVMAMAYAKREAVSRGVRVTVCARATDAACAATTIWDNGWLVFVDNNGNGSVDGTSPADQVLQVRPPLDGNTLRASVRSRVIFKSNGFAGAGNNDTFTLCDTRGAASGLRIIVSLQGWVSTLSGATACP